MIARVSVPEPSRPNVDGDARQEQSRRVDVPQVVKPSVRERLDVVRPVVLFDQRRHKRRDRIRVTGSPQPVANTWPSSVPFQNSPP